MADDPTVPRPTKKPLLPRWLKFLLILVGTFFFLAAGAWVLLDIITRQDLERALAEVQALGWPLTLQELYPDPIPDEENAAVLYQQAFGQLVWRGDEIWGLDSLQAWSGLSEEEQDTVRQALKKNAGSLTLLHQGGQLEKCQFDLRYRDGFAMLLPHLSEIRNAEYVLRAAALVALVDGDTEQACQHWLDAMAVARHAGDEKMLISELVRLACLSISLDALEAFVHSGQLSDSQLAQAALALEDLNLRAGFADGLKGELVFTMDIFARALEDVAKDMGLQSGWGFDLEQALFSLYGSPLARPWRQYDQATYVSMHCDLLKLGEQPYPQAHQQLKQWERKLERLVASRARPVITCMLLPALSRGWEALAGGEARVALARTALALERYRLKHGRYPDALTDLTPDLLPDVPLDPFDGQPLRYIKSPERVAVYSVGLNLQDDGGSEADGDYGQPEDIVFTVRRSPALTEKSDDE